MFHSVILAPSCGVHGMVSTRVTLIQFIKVEMKLLGTNVSFGGDTIGHALFRLLRLNGGDLSAGVYTTILNGYRMPSSYISLDINQLFFVEEFGYADIYFDGLGSVIDFFLSSRQL